MSAIRRLLLLVLGAAAMVAVALLSGNDRVGQVLSGIAVCSLVWAAVAEHRRQESADVRGPRAR